MRSRQPSYESKEAYRQELLTQINQQQSLKKGEVARERELREQEERHQSQMEAEELASRRAEKNRILNEAKEAAAAHVAAKAAAKRREQQLESDVMHRAAQQYAQSAGEREARRAQEAAQYHKEIDLQVAYKKLVQDSQREMDQLLSSMAPPGL